VDLPATTARGVGSEARPVRIDQLVGSVVVGDAISAHTAELWRHLRARGFESEIYVKERGALPRDDVDTRPADEVGPEADVLIYHLSVGSELLDRFLAFPGRKVALYHNITPARYFEGWDPPMVEIMRAGRRDLTRAAPLTDLGVGVSEFNRAELVSAGFAPTAVVPLVVNPADHDVVPDSDLADILQRRREAGRVWLFVGRFAPNKCQADIVKAFAAYRRASDPGATLLLIGAPTTASYRDAVMKVAERLGVEDALTVCGPVSPAQLSACYRAADVFVCLSEHEGFCAPLVEAMYHQVPIVAYRAGAVPETVGSSAVFLDDKDAVFVGAVIDEVLQDKTLRAELVEAGLARIAALAPDQAFRRLDELLADMFQ
jgi:glycosyltransferase involved in cell wall biosynthesis